MKDKDGNFYVEPYELYISHNLISKLLEINEKLDIEENKLSKEDHERFLWALGYVKYYLEHNFKRYQENETFGSFDGALKMFLEEISPYFGIDSLKDEDGNTFYGRDGNIFKVIDIFENEHKEKEENKSEKLN